MISFKYLPMMMNWRKYNWWWCFMASDHCCGISTCWAFSVRTLFLIQWMRRAVWTCTNMFNSSGFGGYSTQHHSRYSVHPRCFSSCSWSPCQVMVQSLLLYVKWWKNSCCSWRSPCCSWCRGHPFWTTFSFGASHTCQGRSYGWWVMALMVTPLIK